VGTNELGSSFQYNVRNIDFGGAVDFALAAVEAAFDHRFYGFALQQISGGIGA
jgi:hypothetical protein